MTTAGILAQQATTHSGVLAVPLLPSENVFFQHFVVFDQRIVQADLFVNDNIIYPPVLSYSVSLRPSLFNAAGAIYAPSLMYNKTLTESIRFDNVNIFYSPRVAKAALFPDLFVNVSEFYPPSVVTVHIRPPLLVNVQEFYAPAVSRMSGFSIFPDDVFTNVNTFYAPTVVPLLTLTRMHAQPRTMTPLQITQTGMRTPSDPGQIP